MTLTAADRRRFGAIGALKVAARHTPGGPTGYTAKARSTFADSFAAGHGCKACGDFIAIPAELSDVERERRRKALVRMHASRMAALSAASRCAKARGAAP